MEKVELWLWLSFETSVAPEAFSKNGKCSVMIMFYLSEVIKCKWIDSIRFSRLFFLSFRIFHFRHLSWWSSVFFFLHDGSHELLCHIHPHGVDPYGCCKCSGCSVRAGSWGGAVCILRGTQVCLSVPLRLEQLPQERSLKKERTIGMCVVRIGSSKTRWMDGQPRFPHHKLRWWEPVVESGLAQTNFFF